MAGGNGGNGQGGGVFNGGPTPLGTPSLTLLRSCVALNRADGGAAGDGGSAGLGQGGGLYLTPGGFACADLARPSSPTTPPPATTTCSATSVTTVREEEEGGQEYSLRRTPDLLLISYTLTTPSDPATTRKQMS